MVEFLSPATFSLLIKGTEQVHRRVGVLPGKNGKENSEGVIIQMDLRDGDKDLVLEGPKDQ